MAERKFGFDPKKPDTGNAGVGKMHFFAAPYYGAAFYLYEKAKVG